MVLYFQCMWVTVSSPFITAVPLFAPLLGCKFDFLVIFHRSLEQVSLCQVFINDHMGSQCPLQAERGLCSFTELC